MMHSQILADKRPVWDVKIIDGDSRQYNYRLHSIDSIPHLFGMLNISACEGLTVRSTVKMAQKGDEVWY